MITKNKIKKIERMINMIDFLEEKDKPSIIAYIRGVNDTRERMKIEMKDVQQRTKGQIERMINMIDFLEEKDKPSIIAYIRGVNDTRERMKIEMKDVQQRTKGQ